MTTRRVFATSRIVALVVIGMVVLGLAYLRLAPSDESVVVPAGSQAGDLALEPCTYPTEDGYEADCGTLVVPENRADLDSRLIALPVARIRALSADAGQPIFRLEGGPGRTNMTFKRASRFADKHDVVLVGYRGVDGSSVLDCPEVDSVLKHSSDLIGEQSLQAYGDALRACANRLQGDGVDLAGYTLPQRVDDLEAARIALGYERIDLISESVGTRTAMIYSWRYPESIHRSVMIAANPPGHFLWDPETTDEQIGRYADLCAEDASCRDRTDDLAVTMRRMSTEIPDRWWFLPIKEGNVRIESFFGLMESTSDAGVLSAPLILDSWLSAAEGDSSGFWFQSLLADLVFPVAFVWGETAATGMQDVRAAQVYYSAGGDQGLNLGKAATAFTWGGGELVDAWPANPSEDRYEQAQTTHVETLLIGGTLDISTPPQIATDELLPHLPNGQQLVLSELGHTTDFWTYQPEASSRLILTFFDRGEVDDSLYTPASVDFTPDATYTALAKGTAGTMVALAVLTIVSLLWMARRVRTRGRFGPRASAMLRSLYPIVLGLGGWFLGALIVLAALPTVPLDDPLLAVLSIGGPVGLGIYWAWVDRDSLTATKRAGFVAAMGGALAGAWLGFNATVGLVAVLTTIVGAAVAANVILIVLDISGARLGRDRFAPTGGPSEPVVPQDIGTARSSL
jgi:pimeloyl-ACP methyl ester carboxylesterase